jgi:hypothetical protein
VSEALEDTILSLLPSRASGSAFESLKELRERDLRERNLRKRL